MQEVLINGGIMSAAFLYTCFIFGHFILKWMKKDRLLYKSIIYGFVGIMGLFEVVAIIFIELKTKYSPLYYVFGGIEAVLIVVATVFFIKNKDYKEYKDSFKLKKYLSPMLIVAVLVIGFQMYNSTYKTHTDADDGYFISISNIALEQDKITYDGNEVYDGTVSKGETIRSNSFSWELHVAYLAKTFGMHPAVICHSVFPALLLLLCYMAFYEVGVNLLDDVHKQRQFLLLIVVLNLFGGYTVYSSGCFMLLRLWQGKAMLPSFFFPMLISNCVDIFKKKDRVQTWIVNAVIVVGGMAMSTVGLYLMPIMYICIGIPVVIIGLVRKEYKETGRTIIRAVITVLPVIIYDLIVIVRLLGTAAVVSYSKSTPPDYFAIFEKNMLQGLYVVILYLAVLYILIWKNSEVGCKVLVGIAATTFATFLNPFFISFVASKVTGVDVYWRLYWIIPIYVIIAYAISSPNITRQWMRFLITAVVAVVICYAGEYIYSDSFYSNHVNKYRVPTEVIEVCRELSDQGETTCVFPADISYYPRQYTSKINVVCARGMGENKEVPTGSKLSYAQLYDKLYVNINWDDESLRTSLMGSGIKYIYSRNEMKCQGYELIKNISGEGYLYKVNGI